jgi:hypothetical protein
MSKILSIVPVLAVLAIACSHQTGNFGGTTTTSGTVRVGPEDGAIDAIATARCEREAKCQSIGEHKPYESYGACVSWIADEESKVLTPVACPRGLDGDRLDKCLSDIRAERCENLADSQSRVAACGTKTLCRP